MSTSHMLLGLMRYRLTGGSRAPSPALRTT